MKMSPAPKSVKKSASKPTKLDRVKGRIARLETTIAKYDERRTKRLAKLATLRTLLTSLAK